MFDNFSCLDISIQDKYEQTVIDFSTSKSDIVNIVENKLMGKE